MKLSFKSYYLFQFDIHIFKNSTVLSTFISFRLQTVCNTLLVVIQAFFLDFYIMCYYIREIFIRDNFSRHLNFAIFF